MKKPFRYIPEGFYLGGRGGIRTPGTLPHAGFQDQCIKPALPLFLYKKIKRFFLQEAPANV